MGQSHFLRLRAELARLAPYQGISVLSRALLSHSLEVRGETPVDTVTDGLDARTLSQADRVTQVWLLSSLFRIHPEGGVRPLEGQVSLLTSPARVPVRPLVSRGTPKV